MRTKKIFYFVDLTLRGQNLICNSIDPDEVDHDELPHLENIMLAL